MSVHRWQPEPGESAVVLLGAGLGLVWLFAGFALAMQGWLGTVGSGDWSVPRPALTPLGIVRLLLLLPIWITLALSGLFSRAGLQPSGGLVIAFAFAVSLGIGALAGVLTCALVRRGRRAAYACADVYCPRNSAIASRWCSRPGMKRKR